LGSQTPAPEGGAHVATQHWIFDAPGQWPAMYVPPVQGEDVVEQKPGPEGVVQDVVARFWRAVAEMVVAKIAKAEN